MLAKKRRKSGYEDHFDEIPTAKKTNLFCASVFRKSIQGEDAITAVKEFVNLCQSANTQNVVLQYLEAGGGTQELLGLLKLDQKNNMTSAVPIFSALQCIIMKTLTEAQQYRPSVEDGCKHLLNLHLSTIHHMLSLKSTAKHRQIVLKLLTAIVTLSSQLARMILSHVKISLPLRAVLIKHTKPVDKSVRTTFIHFLMAFLFDGSVSVIWPLLDIKGLLASIVPGLIYDDCNTVHLVLATVQDKVLMNTSISKTAKLHTFSTPVVRSLFALYDWKGPVKWNPTGKNRNNEIEDTNKDDVEQREGQQIVADAVHDFLQVLCASHKYGIIFHDRSIGTSGKKHNELLQTVLENLERPWEHEQKAKLIIKIVAACPDLMKCVLANVQPYLEPRVSVSWLKAITFVMQLVQSLNPEQALKPYADTLTAHKITNVVHTLTVPSVLLKEIGSQLLPHRQLVIRHEAVNLLLAMLKQFNTFVTCIEQWNLIDASSQNAFKQSVVKKLPNSEMMISLWNINLSVPEGNEDEENSRSDQIVPEPKLSSHLLAMMDLFLLYNKCFPDTLDIPNSINFLTDIEHIMANEEDHEAVAVLQERVLQLLITLDSFAFTPDKEMFGDAIDRLSYLVDYPSTTIPLEARNILCTLLINTGLFEGVVSEVFVWLHCYLAVPADHRKSVARLLVDAIVRVSRNTAMYIDFIIKSEEGAEDTRKVVDNSQLEDIFDELLEASSDEALGERVQEFENTPASTAVSLSPLLPGVLETAATVCDNDQLEGVKYFISCVVIHLLHSQTLPGTMLHLLQRWPVPLPSEVMSYVSGWLSDKSPEPLKKPFGRHSPERKLSNALLQADGNSVSNIVDPSSVNNESSALVPLKESTVLFGKERSCIRDPVHVLLLYKLSVFHMTQLAFRGEFTEKLRDKCKEALLSLLRVVSRVDKRQDESAETFSMEMLHLLDQECLSLHCLKHTFTHPFLLHFFTPINQKKQTVQKLVTELVLELLKLSSFLKIDMISLSGILKPFKQKLIQHIIRRLKKNKLSSLNMDSVVPFVELFELSFSDVLILMDRVVAVPTEALICTKDGLHSLSVWGTLLVYLLGRCITLHKPIALGMVTSIANHVAHLAKQDQLHCTLMEEHFLQYLEQFPHHLEHIQTRVLLRLLQQQNIGSSSVKLTVLLLSRKPVLIHDFISLARQRKKLRQNAAVVLPLLSTAFKCNTAKIEQNILKKIYNEYSTEIRAAILTPSEAAEWLKYYSSVVVQLVYKCMGIKACKDLCREVKSRAVQLDKYEEFYVDLIKCMFTKIIKNVHNSGQSQLDFVLLVLEMMVNLSKENVLDQKQMENMCQALQDCAALTDKWQDISAPIKKSSVWLSFIKVSLKFGLQPHQDTSGKLLDTLVKLCDIIYENLTEEPQIDEIFQWALSHSEFLTVMLGTTQKKGKLVELLFLLVKKDSSVMSSSHIPIFLGSYNATLDPTDQLVLGLLQSYEAGGISLHECRPYLWGEAAVSHYSVKSKVGMSLWRQPQANQVLELLDMNCVLETIKNFPLNRGLKASESLECGRKVYDPAFLLPLFSHLLAPESVVHTYKFISSGGLAVTLAALCSACEDTRAAAYHVVARLYFHEEVCRNVKGRLLSLQFLDAVRNGVASLKNESLNPQLPCIVTTFLARTSLILSQTHHEFYVPLQNFIIAKSSVNLNTIPEFFTFLHSSEVEFRTYRLWILRVIRDGMKSNLDFRLSQRCVVFKLLLGFYSSVLADDDTKKLILEVIQSTVKIPTAAKVLVSTNGLVSWLHQTIRQLSRHDTVFISTLIDIVSSLQTVLFDATELKDGGTGKTKSSVVQYFPHYILLLELDLLPKLGSKMAVADLRKYLNTIQAVISFQNTKAINSLISTQKMFEIVQLSKEVLGSVLDCEDLLTYGCKFAPTTEEESLAFDSVDDNEQAVYHLRNLIIEWLQKIHNSQAAK
ncbi:nucleolar pre-ribosomal-associated protein 1 isoform X2 [Zootermopsis nevadensis]|uniref:nucleolar pre-ribosomal-associated protein 1 isoform X2 n=1 Tax=Zootermopsis nevadensis TaxID=136037 RepID=UPI000B8EBB09|nr:nucleolar pre-ribosomal-associated protein 1 isoform X2 [Zootermopsis nevadensis]